MTSTRAGFWRRLGALILDCIVLTALVQAAALVLYPLSDGRLQANGLLRFVDCRAVTQVPAGVTVPAEYSASGIKACRISLLGLEFAHYLEAAPLETSESTDPWRLPLDRNGAAASVLSLDVLVLPLLMLWRAFTDGRSERTLGRKAAALTVTTSDGGQPSFGTAMLRQALLWWPALLSLPFDAGATFSGGLRIPAGGFELTTTDILGFATFVWLVVAIVMIVRRTDPLYDRWAGTKVMTPETIGP